MPRIGCSESRPARREAAALALALVAAAGFGTARLASARRICRPRLQVVGIPADVGTRPARCTDGDPFCDADGPLTPNVIFESASASTEARARNVIRTT